MTRPLKIFWAETSQRTSVLLSTITLYWRWFIPTVPRLWVCSNRSTPTCKLRPCQLCTLSGTTWKWSWKKWWSGRCCFVSVCSEKTRSCSRLVCMRMPQPSKFRVHCSQQSRRPNGSSEISPSNWDKISRVAGSFTCWTNTLRDVHSSTRKPLKEILWGLGITVFTMQRYSSRTKLSYTTT